MKPVIVFDFGGVLLDWNPRYLFRKVFNGDEQAMEQFLAEVDFFEWNLHQDAGRSFAEGIAVGCEDHPRYCDLLKLYRERWLESIQGPIEGSVEILQALKQSGYRLFALSNWAKETYYLTRDRYEFLNWFEQVVISGEECLAKPDPRIFAVLLEKAGCRAEECVLIDDSLPNIQAAQKMGFQTIHFTSPEALSETLMRLGISNA